MIRITVKDGYLGVLQEVKKMKHRINFPTDEFEKMVLSPCKIKDLIFLENELMKRISNSGLLLILFINSFSKQNYRTADVSITAAIETSAVL